MNRNGELLRVEEVRSREMGPKIRLREAGEEWTWVTASFIKVSDPCPVKGPS